MGPFGLKLLLPLLSIFILFTILFAHSNAATTVETVNKVDLTRYTGLWYEIAKIPNRFQRKCAGNTTARYEIRADGRISVINSCVDEKNRRIVAQGIAKVVDNRSNAKLKVSFVRFLGIQFFWGDYWIIGLDDDYQIAIVGHPKRKYGWILARRQALSEGELTWCHAILREQGYNPDDFVKTRQRL